MGKGMKGITFALVCSVGLFACANGYKKFYHQIPGATPERIAATREAHSTGNPIVERTGLPPESIRDQYSEAGYAAIGYSSFNGGAGAAESGAIAQAKAVEADLVVISNPSYTGTQSSVVPIVTPTTSTSYSSGSATAYGGYGAPVTAYGSSTTTTYGTQTNYIPVKVDRYDYAAVYMVKQKIYLGIQYRPLTPDERAAQQSNHGVAVTVVVRGSNAFRNDILVGDVILAVNGEPVDGPDELSRMIEADKGTIARISIRRNGSLLEKMVPIAK
jgi:hypothetical protein